MRLLDKWEGKQTQEFCMPMYAVYQSRETGYKDIDMREVCNREKELTLNLKIASGFSEIGFTPNQIDYSRFEREITMPDNVEDIAVILNELIYLAFLRSWDPKIPHIIFCSGGRDSRILAWTIKTLEEEQDMGEYKFICHGLESYLFQKAMKEIGFREDQWQIWNKEGILKPDYYRFPDLGDYNVNGFAGPNILFHDEMDEKKVCLVLGTFFPGFAPNELIESYLGFYISSFTNVLTAPHIYYPAPLVGELYYKWGDMFAPYLDYNFLNFRFKIPAKYFIWTQGGDLIRDLMLKQFGSKTEYYHGHTYNFEFSEPEKKRINNMFQNSMLLELYPELRGYTPTDKLYYRENLPTKLYGLASVIEGIEGPTFNPQYPDTRENASKGTEMRKLRDEEAMEWLRNDT